MPRSNNAALQEREGGLYRVRVQVSDAVGSQRVIYLLMFESRKLIVLSTAPWVGIRP